MEENRKALSLADDEMNKEDDDVQPTMDENATLTENATSDHNNGSERYSGTQPANSTEWVKNIGGREDQYSEKPYKFRGHDSKSGESIIKTKTSQSNANLSISAGMSGKKVQQSRKHRRNLMPVESAIEEKPPTYDDVINEVIDALQIGNMYFKDVKHLAVLSRLQEIENSTSETGDVVREVQQTLQQHIDETRRERQEHIERTMHASHVSEERISQRVADELLKNEKFQRLMQSRESSVSCSDVKKNVHGDPPDPPSLSHKCCCKRKCSCSCHLTDLNEKWKRERRPDGKAGRYTGTSRKTHSVNVDKKKVASDIESDTDVVKDFKNNLSYVSSDSDRETPIPRLRTTENFKMSSLEENESENGLPEVNKASIGDPGGPPSDDSSSDDDSGDRHWNKRNKHAQNNSGKKAKEWIIDAEAWKICVEQDDDFENEAARLLDQGKLPDQVILNEMCSKYNRLLPCLQNICDGICSFIKNKSKEIVHVWPACKYEHDNSIYGKEITFVVLSETSDTTDSIDFTTVRRCIFDVKGKKENAKIHEKELKERPSIDEIEGLEKCLKEHARELMKRHSKLTRVTASWYKSSGNETDTVSLMKQNCIALYVHVKGFIPLNEEPFPDMIGDYPVDVREGIFELCRGPKDYHKNVKMGCAIKGEERQQGTLGAFIKFENDSCVYCITSAHVVFAGEKLKEILKHRQVEFKPHSSDEIVYQPSSDIFGNARLAFYKQGGNGIPGVEIVLMEVKQERWPTDGSFPDDSNHVKFGFGPEKPYEFCSGRVTELTNRHHSSVVYKYGCESKITEGVHRFSGASVRSHTFKDNILGEELIMHDQIEIMDIDGGTFAIQGDSGALVVADEHGNQKLSAVGIIEGKMAGGNVYTVTPINAILNELSRYRNRQCTLKCFLPFNAQSGDPGFEKEVMEKVTSLAADVTNLGEKISRIDQGLAQDLAEHKNEISYQLQKQNKEHKKQTQELKDQQTANSNKMEDNFKQVIDLLNSMRQNTS